MPGRGGGMLHWEVRGPLSSIPGRLKGLGMSEPLAASSAKPWCVMSGLGLSGPDSGEPAGRGPLPVLLGVKVGEGWGVEEADDRPVFTTIGSSECRPLCTLP